MRHFKCSFWPENFWCFKTRHYQPETDQTKNEISKDRKSQRFEFLVLISLKVCNFRSSDINVKKQAKIASNEARRVFFGVERTEKRSGLRCKDQVLGFCVRVRCQGQVLGLGVRVRCKGQVLGLGCNCKAQIIDFNLKNFSFKDLNCIFEL